MFDSEVFLPATGGGEALRRSAAQRAALVKKTGSVSTWWHNERMPLRRSRPVYLDSS